MNHPVYTIHVSVAGSSDTEHTIMQQYSDFLRLHERLTARWQNADLPPMPPKSTFRRKFVPAFMVERQAMLGEFLSAAVAYDPTMENVDLRLFLGVLAATGLEKEFLKSGVVGCAEEDDSFKPSEGIDGDDDSTYLGEDSKEYFRSTSRGEFGSTSFGSEDEAYYQATKPNTFEIFQRLDEIQARNKALEKENAMITNEVTSSAPGALSSIQYCSDLESSQSM